MSATAVSACSPPDSRVSAESRLPGGWAMISSPASSGSSLSTSSRCAWPPSNRVVNRLRKWPSTFSNASSSRTRPSRFRLPIEPRSRWIAWASSSFSATLDSRLVSSSDKFLLGDQIDRADPLALGGQAVKRFLLDLRVAQDCPRRSRAVRAATAAGIRTVLAANPCIFHASPDLGVGTSGCAGPGLARRSEGFARLSQCAASDRNRFLRVAFCRGCFGDFRLALACRFLEPLDLGSMAVRLSGQLLLLLLHRHCASGGFGQPLIGLQPAGAPFP